MKDEQSNNIFDLFNPKNILTAPFSLTTQILTNLQNLLPFNEKSTARLIGTNLKTLRQEDVDFATKTLFENGLGGVSNYPSREHSLKSNPEVKNEPELFGSAFNERSFSANGKDHEKDIDIFGSSFTGREEKDSEPKKSGENSIF